MNCFFFFHHDFWGKVKSEVAQSCPTLSNPMDCSPPGSSVHGILQTRVLEWAAIAFSRKIAAAAAKSLQSCPTLCDPIDSSPPGSPVPGILQARTLEWVAISFSNAWKGKVKVKSLSRVPFLATPQNAAYQASPSMGWSFPMRWLFTSGGQSIGTWSFSFSISPSNEYSGLMSFRID